VNGSREFSSESGDLDGTWSNEAVNQNEKQLRTVKKKELVRITNSVNKTSMQPMIEEATTANCSEFIPKAKDGT